MNKYWNILGFYKKKVFYFWKVVKIDFRKNSMTTAICCFGVHRWLLGQFSRFRYKSISFAVCTVQSSAILLARNVYCMDLDSLQRHHVPLESRTRAFIFMCIAWGQAASKAMLCSVRLSFHKRWLLSHCFFVVAWPVVCHLCTAAALVLGWFSP